MESDGEILKTHQDILDRQEVLSEKQEELMHQQIELQEQILQQKQGSEISIPSTPASGDTPAISSPEWVDNGDMLNAAAAVASMQSNVILGQQLLHVSPVATGIVKNAVDENGVEKAEGVRKGRFFVTTIKSADLNGMEDEIVEDSKVVLGVGSQSVASTDYPGSISVRKGRFTVRTEADEEEDASDNIEINPSRSEQAKTPVANVIEADQSDVPKPQRLQGESLSTQKGAPRKATPGNIMIEVQKISAQNRKLHKMLLDLSNAKNNGPMALGHVDESKGKKPAPQSTLIKDNPSDPPNRSAASQSSAPRLRELMVEMDSVTMKVVTENDELKMRNILLTKELNNVKEQLREAELKISSLQQLSTNKTKNLNGSS